MYNKIFISFIMFSMMALAAYCQQDTITFSSPVILEGGGTTVSQLVLDKGNGRIVSIKGFNPEGLTVLETSIKLREGIDSVDWSNYLTPAFSRYGLRHGKHYLYYDNGTPRWYCTFKEGSTVGAQQRWHKAGGLLSKVKSDGTIIVFNQDGTHKVEIEKTQEGIKVKKQY